MQTQTTHAPSSSTSRARLVEGVYKSPGFHWVGDGFRVAGYMSVIPDAIRKLSPFLLLDYHAPHAYAPSQKNRGVGVHPHRGFETVSLAWEGSVAHKDSSGGGGVIGPGDVQWMTAASGILHKEFHEEKFSKEGGTFHMAQLWVNLPKAHKMDAPRYQALVAAEMGIFESEDRLSQVRVIAGEYQGVKGPAKTFSKINLLDVKSKAGGRLDFAFPAHENTAFLVMKGEVSINQETVAKENDLVIFQNRGEEILLEAKSDVHVLVLNGEPIDEPVVQYGPFVMNTEEEIVQAIADFQNGKFGRLS